MSLHSLETCDLLIPLRPIACTRSSKRRRSRLPGLPRSAPSPKPSVPPGTAGSNCLAAASVSAAEAIPAGCRARDHGSHYARSCARHCARSVQHRSDLLRPLPSATAAPLRPQRAGNLPHQPSPATRTAAISRRPSVPLSSLVEASQLHPSRLVRWPPPPTPPRLTRRRSESPPLPRTLTARASVLRTGGWPGPWPCCRPRAREDIVG